ncbi:MAG: hypothetical protein R3C68_05445 [Myxococcota bacterium]
MAFFLPRSGVTLISFNGNSTYSFFERDLWTAMAIVGLNISHANAEFAGATRVGLNVGIGGEYDFGFADGYADIKYVISKFDQLVIGVGLRWALL